MKYQYILAFSACALGVALTPAFASADQPAGDAAKRPDLKHGKPGEHAGKPDGKPGDHAGKPDDKAEHGEHGKPGDDDHKPGDDAKAEGRGEHFHGALRELHEELKAGKLKKEELKDKLAKLRESSGERGKQHRQELGKRWGTALAQPSAVEELKHHARRMAFLDRAMLLAETEAKDKDKPKLSERITQLIDKENARHEHAMEALKSLPTTPAAAASAVPAAAAPSAAPAAADAKGDAK